MESISDSGPQLTELDIRRLESKLRVVLPDDYRKFLLLHNGGKPDPNGVNVHGWPNNPRHKVQVLFRIGGKVPSSELDWNFHATRNRVPKDLLPVGSTGTGDLFCIVLSGKNKNAVYVWDSQSEHPEATYSNVYRVADSFSDFVGHMYAFDPLEPQQ